MPKNIVVCCDGTGNEFGVNLTNVLKLYRMLEKNDSQVVMYEPGVGTMGLTDSWGRFRQNVKAFLGLATGYGLDDEILGAYRFLVENYNEGDQIFLFGFSRGAYTVRALAGFIYLLGLMRPDQLNYAGYAFSTYKRAAIQKGKRTVAKDESPAPVDKGSAAARQNAGLYPVWHFKDIAGGRTVPIKFVGVWDSVASVIVPRPDRFYIPSLIGMPYTHQNPGVEFFRHAIAIDEFRRMFRLCRWMDNQHFKPDHFAKTTPQMQDIREVWFAGCHSDIGGGYPEDQSGLSKFPLRWMIQEAKAHGLHVNDSMYQHLVEGQPTEGSKHVYAKPDATAKLHVSMSGIWRLLEWLPKKTTWRDWTKRRSILGYYLPHGEPRSLLYAFDNERSFEKKPLIHESVIARKTILSSYRPVNLPAEYDLEP